MEINEVSEILGLFRALMAPQHVFITDEAVKEEVDGQVYFRGLQPRAQRDVIFLTRDADASSPIHEAVHAQFNLGEIGTGAVTRVLLAKARFIQSHPMLKDVAPQRKPEYQECPGCAEFPLAHSPKYAGRVKHYVRT